jgi:acetoin utilization deacetylase AcuC-like enzyme
MLKIAYSPIYKYPLPEGHRFPMIKYELIPEQLIYEGIVTEEHFCAPQRLDDASILSVHSSDYLSKLVRQELLAKESRRIGFPMTPLLVERGRYISQGTIDCALHSRTFGVSMNIAGGTHHAYADHGEGFCILNDFAIASQYLLDHGLAKKILIIDLDVHQGNGTAHIFRDEPSVFTFSMHGKKNYPHRKENSDLDIALEDDTDDEEYLSTLARYLPSIIEDYKPDQIFYLAGVDVLATDRLGRLALSQEGVRQRDAFVFNHCKNNHIPVAVSMGGGYSPKIGDIVDAHVNTFREAQEIYF